MKLYSVTWVLFIVLTNGGTLHSIEAMRWQEYPMGSYTAMFTNQKSCDDYRTALARDIPGLRTFCIEQDESGYVPGQGYHDK